MQRRRTLATSASSKPEKAKPDGERLTFSILAVHVQRRIQPRNTKGASAIERANEASNALRVIALFAALLVGLPVEARPVNLRCTMKDKKQAAYFGPLAVEVDLDALSVQIEAPEKLRGYRWEYRNGQVAPPLVRAPPGTVIHKYLPATTPVLQFVEVIPHFVRMGWRTQEGELAKLSSFNLSALGRPAEACIWHTATVFELS